MKTHFVWLLILVSLAFTPVLAQRRFSAAITAAPVLSHSHARQTVFLPDPANPGGPPIENTFDVRSTVGGYKAGVSVQYNLTPAWSVATGLWRYQTSTTGLFPFAPGQVSTRIIASAWQVPLVVNYRPTTRRLSPYFSVGVVGTSRRPTVYKPAEGSGFSETRVLFGKKAVSFQALVGAGVAYRLNSHVSLTLQPQLIWQFRPSGNYQQYTSYQINGQTQLVYSF